MKKRVLTVLLSAVMALTMTGCGGTKTDESGKSSDSKENSSAISGQSTEKVTKGKAPKGAKTIEVWSEDRHDLDYIESMIDKYNKTNEDGIFINLTIISDDYENMVKLAIDSGTAPDIVGANAFPLFKFIDNDLFVPLNDYIDADQEYQKVNEPYEHSYEGANAHDGKIYHVYSGMRSGVRVEYNKDLLAKDGYDEIPAKLSDYIDMAKDVTEKGNGDVYGIGFTSASPFERLLEMSAQVSGIYYYDYTKGKFDFSGYKEILEQGKRFMTENIAYPDQQGVDNMRALFAQGKFALWSNASQEAGVFTQQIPIDKFEWGVAQVPSLTGEIKGALQTTPSKSYAILSSSKQKDLAWKVISYFQSEEFTKGYLEKGYCLPITDYMDGIIDKSKTGRLADFSMLDYESVYPTVPNVNLTGDDYRTVLWNAVMGYVEIDDAIKDLNTRYNEALDADVKAGNSKRLVISDYDPMHPDKGTVSYKEK